MPDTDDTTSSPLADVRDRVGMTHILGRFLHALEDGHAFYTDYGAPTEPEGCLLVQIQRIQGWPVIRASVHDGLQAGDTITAIDGESALDWLAEVMARASAASEGYLFEVATRELRQFSGTRQLTLVDPDGAERSVEVTPLACDRQGEVPWAGTHRPSGWLGDLGAADVLFLNMSGDVTTGDDDWRPVVEQLGSARAVVVDMRGYPAVSFFEVLRYLNDETFSSPIFVLPTWQGPNEPGWSEIAYDIDPAEGAFSGPIALLTSNQTISAAESFCQMLFLNDNVTVVGQQTGATSGNLTRSRLPGQFRFSFTGMRIYNPDGSALHGVGIAPDVEVVPTPPELRDGLDPELLAALAQLGG